MALTQVAISSRRGIRYAVYFIVFLTIGRIILGIAVGIYKQLFPSPPPAPTLKFGKLTKIPFPDDVASPKLTYTIETPEGTFPKTPDQSKVYFMPKSSANLLALDVAKDAAKKMGFQKEESQESEYLYSFSALAYPTILKTNIITKNFSISYDLNADRTPIDLKPPAPEIAASNFKTILQNGGYLPEDLTGEVTHDFYKLNNGELINVISLSESDLVKVNLFRKNYDDLPSITANPEQANVWAIMSGAQNKEQQIVAAEYRYFPIDEAQSSTYPIKTSELAFSELQNGNAYIADSGSNKEGDNVKIRRIYLANFDSNIEANFFQPVFVFEGDNNFVAYVPAVTSDYYGGE